MQPIADWLKELGMSEYAERFAENDIDMVVLPDLTDQHLKDLGVSLGHRLKMLRAIRDLSDASVAATASAGPVVTEPARRDEAERRQLTVMFTDLVGSTALSTKLDPEDMRSVIGAYHKCVAETVARFDGFVAKYMGDGALIYFGYPQAHEDDAERAVAAGLAVVEAVPKLDIGPRATLRVRIGIATGLVVVGDLLGEGAAQEQAVVGETPNLAARLQALAEPGAVVIAASTRRLTAGLFEYRDLGTVALKGFAEDAPAWQVLGLGSAEGRFEALRTATTPLVGRDEEVELLVRRWEQAKRGDGQVVLIAGEPGIGKSRIAQTIVEYISAEPHTRLRYFCSPHHQDSALYPSIAQLERAAGFRRDDTPEQRLAKLEAVLAHGTNDLSETVPLLADLLSIPIGDRYPPLNLTPQKRRERTLHAQVAQVEGLAARQPVLMVFEDVHWSDPTTRESLDLIVDRVQTLRVLVLITFRPEFSPPWVGRPHVTLLTLSRLPLKQRAEMITRVTGGKALPKEIADQIVDRTDGVPLFIEELTKTVVESGILTEAGGHYTVTGPVTPLAIPTTLQASLLARLGRLAATREIAQIGAALGRQFSHELISAVAPMPQQKVDDALAQLVDAELIFRRGTPPDAEYTFKHALVQDAAYSTLLHSRRQALRARIATTLERQFPEIVSAQPALLARHCVEAGLTDKAVGYWCAAGEQAVRRAANREAIGHFQQALALNEQRPRDLDCVRTELAILSQLGPALMSVHGWPVPEVGVAFERAGKVARQLESSVDLAPPLVGLFVFHTAVGQFARAEEIVDELFTIARRVDDQDILLQAHHTAWPIRWFRGLHRDAIAHVDAGLNLYDEVRHARHRFLYMGHDPAVCAMSIGATVRWVLGYPEQALRLEHEAISLARRLQHPPSLAHALWFVGEAQIARADAAAAMATAEELLTLSDDQGLPQTRAIALMFLGWAMGQTGNIDEGLRYLEQGLAAWNALGARNYLTRAICLLAETYLRARRYGECNEQLDLAVAVCSELGERWYLPRMHMLRAHLLLQQRRPDVDRAQLSLRMAIDVAQAQSAKGWELRAANSLTRLWAEQGKRTEARDLLAPIHGWFTEGFDTPVLQDAKALLDQLA